MANSIKFPTMLTNVLDSRHERCAQMVSDVCNLVTNYSGLPINEKFVYNYRGRARRKVIKNISTSQFMIGPTPVVELEIEEYKCGLSDLYLDEGNQVPHDITDTDKLGSKQNYALLYPFVQDNNGVYENRWLVIIYDTPDKVSEDIVNTVKCVVSNIFEFPFRYIIPRDFVNGNRIPKVEVQFSVLENGEDQNVSLRNYIVSNKVKKQKVVIYEDVPTDEATELLNDNREGWKKKVVKIFKSKDNDRAYQKYVYDTNDNGVLKQAYASKFSYSHQLEEGDNVYDLMFRRACYIEVINNYLSNGGD